MSYIGADELVFNNDTENGIHTGGFSVKSIMMKNGVSPILTLNKDQMGGSNNVSDLFNDLVVPNWALSYTNQSGGNYKKDIDNESDDDVIEDDIHDKLIDLVRKYDLDEKKTKEVKSKKSTKKQLKKKGGTKKIRK
jgi:hypothetical protein